MPTTFAKPINKFSTTLLTAHTSGSGTLVLRSVSGLGTLDANQVFRVTALASPNTSSETIVGIFEATGISGSTLTGVTAVEGYSDTLIAANTTIQIRATAKTFTDLQSAVNTLETAASTYALDSAVVHDTGDETIAGTKTFSTTIVGSISGNAATVTNGVYTSGSYANPSWITSLAGSKISGDITGNSANVTGIVAKANGGTGTATPSLVAGSNIEISGTWPNQTIATAATLVFPETIKLGTYGTAKISSATGNTCFGELAGANYPSVSETVFMGRSAGTFNQGDRNVGIGTQAGYVVSGSSNVFIGYNCGGSVGSAAYNTFLGQGAGSAASNSTYNAFVGSSAGASAGSSTYCSYFGAGSGDSSARSYAIAIGAGAVAAANHTCAIGASGANSVKVVVNGTTATGQFDVNINAASRRGLVVNGTTSQTGELIALLGTSSTTSGQDMATITTAWSVSTHASRLADLVFSTTGYNGAHEAIRFRDTGSTADVVIPIDNVRSAADDAAAAALSPPVPVGGLYRTGSFIKIRES